jgi:putative PIN family toxin of toxin-antitoxin system
MQRVLIDTNVFVSALMAPDTAPRAIIRLCLQGMLQPLMGNALFAEHEDVLSRGHIFKASVLSAKERTALFEAHLSTCSWTRVHYLWRPNLRDEADNHLIELAVAGGAKWLITGNERDLAYGEMAFPGIRVATPRTFIEQWR